MNIVFARYNADRSGLIDMVKLDAASVPMMPWVSQTVWLKHTYVISNIGWRFTEDEDDAIVCVVIPIES